MKSKFNFKKVNFTELSIFYRENVLNAEVTDVTPNGVWIKSPAGEVNFVSRTQIRAMYNFLSKCL